MFNPKWVLFEGPDRAGKSTTGGMVYIVRGSNDNIQDRGLLTSAFYSSPDQGINYHLDMLRAWLNLPTSRMIVMMISYETQYNRAKQTGHAIIPVEQFQKEIEFYTKYYKQFHDEYPDKVLLVDANQSQDKVVQDIVDFLAIDEQDQDNFKTVHPLDANKLWDYSVGE